MTPADDKDRLIAALRQEGIRDEKVLNALAAVPRETFVASSLADQAYANTALPIECGQTISQPFVVAYMTEKLELGPDMRVLEIGTGSGYQAAVLAQLCRQVYTIERFEALKETAEARFAELGLDNISARFGDGMAGWPETAPFERILVTAAAGTVPQALFDQLAEGGLMVVPLEGALGVEYITRVWRRDGQQVTETLEPVRFVPLMGGAVPGDGETG